MPVFKNRTAFQVVRNITAFLTLDAGVVRGEAPNPELVKVQAKELREKLKQAQQQGEKQREQLEKQLERQKEQLERQKEQLERQKEQLERQKEQLERQKEQLERRKEQFGEQIERQKKQLDKQKEQLEQGRHELGKKDRRIAHLEKLGVDRWGTLTRGVDPENLVWVFGTIRTGSTWLGSMMGSLKRHAMWNEPRVGELFGHFFYERSAHRKENDNFILGLQRKLVWLRSIRTFVLDAVNAKYPKLGEDHYLVIKEPSGSIGAPLLMEALPESRMIFLVRDPRDVVASALDAARADSWARQLKGNQRRRKALADGANGQQDDGPKERPDGFGKPPEAIVEKQATMYLRSVGRSKQAYEAHEGRKVLVRYEDLRADTLATMKRIYSELEIEVDEEELERVMEEHSWENIPEEEKGPGKFKRKATPGGWREDLTPEQVRTVEEITAPLLQEFYPEEERGRGEERPPRSERKSGDV